MNNKAFKIILIVVGIIVVVGVLSPKTTPSVVVQDKNVIYPSSTPVSTKMETLALTGTGAEATKLFVLQSGLRRFTLKYDGASNFIVKLLDEQGNPAGGAYGLDSLLVNEIGSYSGSKAVQIKETGNYLLSVEAEGKWTIVIE